MILLESDWGAPWSRELFAYDACPSGMGACVRDLILEVVRRLGRCRKTERHRDAGAIAARVHALTGLGGAPGAEDGPAARDDELAFEVESLTVNSECCGAAMAGGRGAFQQVG